MAVSRDELEFDVGCRSVEPLAEERRKVARPSAGFAMESFECGTCGKTVTVKVASRKSVLSMRRRAGSSLLALLVVATLVFRTVELREISASGVALVALAIVCVLAAVRQLARLFAPGFRLAFDPRLQRELERAHLGGQVHVFSKPGKDAWT